MTGIAEIENNLIDKTSIRKDIMEFESMLREHPDAFVGDNISCPLKHSFADGIYVREITIPAGMILTGKVHKHAHPNFLLKGEVEVFTESGGSERLIAPCSMISKAGTKRIVHTLTQVVWTTVHHNPNNITDIDKLEDIVIAKDYLEYEKFKMLQGSYFNRIKIAIKKLLS